MSFFLNIKSYIWNPIIKMLGLLYFWCIKFFPKGDTLHRSSIPGYTRQFRGLLLGIILILGISASFGLPMLYRSKKFGEQVL
jgi:hypothetical protein